MIDHLRLYRGIENAAKTGSHGELTKLLADLDAAVSEGKEVIRIACAIVTEARALAAVAELEGFE